MHIRPMMLKAFPRHGVNIKRYSSHDVMYTCHSVISIFMHEEGARYPREDYNVLRAIIDCSLGEKSGFRYSVFG